MPTPSTNSQDNQDNQDKPRRRKPLGRALTVDELIKAVGVGDEAGDVIEAQQWWEEHAPAPARKLLLSKKSGNDNPQK